MNSNSKVFPHTFWQSIGTLILSLVLAAPFLFISQGYELPKDLESSVFFILYCVLFIAIVYFVNLKRKKELSFQFKLSNVTQLPLLALILITFQIGINVPFHKLILNILHAEAIPRNPFSSISFTLGAIVIGPVLEEIIFRGIILKGLLISHNPKKAIVLSAILFGAVHVAPAQILGALIFGGALGWVFYTTKSIGITIVLHVVANAMGLLGSYVHFRFESPRISSISSFYGEASPYIIISSLALLALSLHNLYREYGAFKVQERLINR